MTTDDAVPGRTTMRSGAGIDFGRGARLASIASGTLGGLAVAGVLYAGAYGYLLSLGGLLGQPTVAAGLGVVVGLGAVLGLLFGSVLAAMYVDRRVLADTAPTAGLVYGLALAIPVSSFLLPALVGAMTRFQMAVPNLSITAMLAWVVYGGVVGIGSRSIFLLLPVPDHRPTTGPQLWSGDEDAIRAAGAGGLAGGVVGGIFLYVLAGPLYLQYVGSVTQFGGSVGRGLLGWLAVALLFGVGFAPIAARTVTSYTNTVIAITSRNESIRGLILPAVRRSPLTTTAASVGIVYGVVVGMLAGVLALPYLVVAVTPFTYTSTWNPLAVVFAFGLYGGVLGAVYGAILEGAIDRIHVDFEGRVRPAALAGLVAWAIAGSVVYIAAPTHLSLLGAIVGTPTPVAGLALFFLLALALALVFALTVAEIGDGGPGYVSRLTAAGMGYGIAIATLVGGLLIPIIAAEVTRFTPSVPLLNPTVLFAYVVFGVALGAAYGTTREGTGSRLSPHARAIVGGAVAGVAVGGTFLFLAAPSHLRLTALAVGLGPNSSYGLGVFTVVGLLFGIGFGAVAGLSIDETSPSLATGVIGLWFGLLLAIPLGLFGVNALADANTAMSIPVPAGKFVPIVGGYVLYGITVSLGYRAIYRLAVGATSADIDRMSTVRAGGFGSILGAFLGGLVLHYAAGPPLHMRFVGAPIGLGGSIAQGWVAWTLLSIVLGMLFVLTVSGKLEAYAVGLSDATDGSTNLQMLLGPGVDRAPVTTTATLAGLAYGIACALIVGALVVPLIVNVRSNARLPLPFVDLLVWLGYIVYGTALGFGYGAVSER